MRRRSGMDNQRLGVSNVCEVTREFEFIDDCATDARVAFDAEAENASECVGTEETFGVFVAWVAREAGIRDPSDAGVMFEPLCERERVVGVPLCA